MSCEREDDENNVRGWGKYGYRTNGVFHVLLCKDCSIALPEKV